MKKQHKNHNSDFLHLKTGSIVFHKEKEESRELPQYMDISAQQNPVVEIGITESLGDMESEEIPDEGEIRELQELSRFNSGIVEILEEFPEVKHFFNLLTLSDSESYDDERSVNDALRKSIGTYSNLITQAKEQGISKDVLDQGFDIEAAQKYALLQLWVKAEDAHGGNILITLSDENKMIPISMDLSRCLGHDLESGIMLPRTTRWEQWPALDNHVDEGVKTFILKQKPNILIKKLEKEFFRRFGTELNREQMGIFTIKFHHLYANMTMVQEAVKEGLNFKQIVALILPVIDSYAFNFVTQGVLVGGDLWPARKRYAALKTSFREAWNQATSSSTFKIEVFKESIRHEIHTIKQLSFEKLDTQYFRELCFQLRRGLFL